MTKSTCPAFMFLTEKQLKTRLKPALDCAVEKFVGKTFEEYITENGLLSYTPQAICSRLEKDGLIGPLRTLRVDVRTECFQSFSLLIPEEKCKNIKSMKPEQIFALDPVFDIDNAVSETMRDEGSMTVDYAVYDHDRMISSRWPTGF